MVSFLLEIFKNNGLALFVGLDGKNLLFATIILMGNVHTQTVLVGQVQGRGFLKGCDKLDVLSIDSKVSLGRTFEAEAIVNILKDAVGGKKRITMVVARDSTELELLQALVAFDTSNKLAAVKFLGHIGAEFATQELEGLVLLDASGVRNALGSGCRKRRRLRQRKSFFVKAIRSSAIIEVD